MTLTTNDPFVAFKQAQKAGWAFFTPLQAITTGTAARLVKHARIRSGQRVLDVGCGTGVVAITAARLGAKVTGLDLTPELLAEARENARIANVDIEWHEGDAEDLRFDSNSFDAVVSQFGHMFAPRPDVAVSQMLRVLKPGGTIAFSTWPPELFVGRMFALIGNYMPPLPTGVAPSPQWGDPNIVRQRLGDVVRDVLFDRATMLVPTLSPQHSRVMMERTAGPVLKLVEMLSATDPEKLEKFRREFEAIVAEYYDDNIVRQDYLMTRANKI
jgi:SAM-dependent methyltransferase